VTDRPSGASGGPVVDRLDPSRREQAIAAASRAFWPDPLFGWFARDPVQEHRMLPIFLGALVRDALPAGDVWAATIDDRIVGTAAWYRPGALPRPRGRELRIYLACARALVNGRNRRTGLRLLDAVEKAHPVEPHWYLALLGVDPSQQRRGLGTLLLEPVLTHCDTAGEPAYLETQKPDNLAYYARFGFEVRDEITVGASPPVWLLWREPRS